MLVVACPTRDLAFPVLVPEFMWLSSGADGGLIQVKT